MSRDNRTSLAIKLDAFRRVLLWNFFSDRTPHYLVSEYPKSGGSWVAQMIAEYLGIPFPRNRSVKLRQPTSLLHGHFLYSRRFHNAVYVLRDGRDVMTSAYFHMLTHNDRNPAPMVDRHRSKLRFDDYDDVVGNLPRFIEYLFVERAKGWFHFNWTDFVNSLDNDRAIVVKYEDLLDDTTSAMEQVLARLLGTQVDREKLNRIVDRFSFSTQTNRKPEEEDRSSFLRKGTAGDWREKFSPEARQVFNRYAGKALIDTGYEPDSTWVTRPQ